MFNSKKAAFGFITEYVTAAALLFLILAFFITYFIVAGGASSEQVTISGHEIPASPKLINILKTNVNDIVPEEKEFANKNYAELIKVLSQEPNKDKAKTKFNELLSPLLIKMGNTLNPNIGWNFKVYNGKIDQFNQIPELSVSIRANSISAVPVESFAGANKITFFREVTTLKLKDQTPLSIELYLTCNDCTDKQLENYV